MATRAETTSAPPASPVARLIFPCLADACLLADEGGGDIGKHGGRDRAEQATGLSECTGVVFIVDLVTSSLKQFEECVSRCRFARPQADFTATAIGEPADRRDVRFAPARALDLGVQVRRHERHDCRHDVWIAGVEGAPRLV